MEQLEKKLGYVFKKRSFLETSLRHSSYVNEQPGTSLEDNECLEFLGDAVLSLSASHILIKQFPDLKEGDLSRMRAGLVNESRLAYIARSIGLGFFLKLGKGELLSGGQKKNSILADAMEAVIAAVYLDGGFEASFKLVKRHLAPFVESIPLEMNKLDYKSQLQEFVQGTHKLTPTYKVIDEIGPDHDKTFTVQINIKGIKVQGRGKSKKAAEQEAAKKCFAILNKKPTKK